MHLMHQDDAAYIYWAYISISFSSDTVKEIMQYLLIRKAPNDNVSQNKLCLFMII